MSQLSGWPHPGVAPFHAGERAAQARTGVAERMAEIGHRAMRGAMPQQHRDFFPLLHFVALGAVDAQSQPWATLLARETPGFVFAPDEATLQVDALPPADDPLADLLNVGASLGLLGIELPTRRRNRANGHVTVRTDKGFSLAVLQSFGNCPKYIQTRELLPPAWPRQAPAATRRGRQLDAGMRALVNAADTFFIATHAAGEGPNGGSDVSHRGGRPGFVRVSDDGRSLTWPDFTGNSFFNTLGNLLAQPQAGLVVPDFTTGGLLHIAGRAEVMWEGPQVRAFAGAQRLVTLDVDEALFRPAVLPWRWDLVEQSRALEGTGTW
ncbi:pyridoxamine 5'-phosphate oxidase family protein [Ramlibacter solisilvae]|uniref:Pyridoxamine 5'-phosphate oxidase N-terminal domain-containing protein n=1 Tax=Ramlibacter tataouinensis TaxID=94132 RepID=A0A127JXZ9_9BURK|nr:pyridoxamine 5'-phosphate oxidase family protein [Ramlibacter tataouinensis]AMO24877.1 hypothetical protein UC35_21135 [Ramlibacter tataouinensis]